MIPAELDRLTNWFRTYVSVFYTGDTGDNLAIRLKEEHTARVRQNIRRIAEGLGLASPDIYLAECAALFHDIGRFRQYAVYGTFNDRESENHALLGVRELAMNRVLTPIPLQKRRLVVRAIAFHNLAALPPDEPPESLRLVKMLRDADKLDIWQIFADHYEARAHSPNPVIEMGLPDHPVFSKNAVRAFHESRIVHSGDIKTVNDLKLLHLSWVFDMNFRPSLEIALQNGVLERIAATLPRTRELGEAVEIIYRHIRNVQLS